MRLVTETQFIFLQDGLLRNKISLVDNDTSMVVLSFFFFLPLPCLPVQYEFDCIKGM